MQKLQDALKWAESHRDTFRTLTVAKAQDLSFAPLVAVLEHYSRIDPEAVPLAQLVEITEKLFQLSRLVGPLQPSRSLLFVAGRLGEFQPLVCTLRAAAHVCEIVHEILLSARRFVELGEAAGIPHAQLLAAITDDDDGNDDDEAAETAKPAALPALIKANLSHFEAFSTVLAAAQQLCPPAHVFIAPHLEVLADFRARHPDFARLPELCTNRRAGSMLRELLHTPVGAPMLLLFADGEGRFTAGRCCRVTGFTANLQFALMLRQLLGKPTQMLNWTVLGDEAVRLRLAPPQGTGRSLVALTPAPDLPYFWDLDSHLAHWAWGEGIPNDLATLSLPGITRLFWNPAVALQLRAFALVQRARPAVQFPAPILRLLWDWLQVASEPVTVLILAPSMIERSYGCAATFSKIEPLVEPIRELDAVESTAVARTIASAPLETRIAALQHLMHTGGNDDNIRSVIAALQPSNNAE